MSSISKRAYYNLCLQQDVYWLRTCVAEPGPHMRPMHLRIIRLAIRNLTRVQRS